MGTLHLKPTANQKTQLLVRADTNLGGCRTVTVPVESFALTLVLWILKLNSEGFVLSYESDHEVRFIFWLLIWMQF